MKAEATPETVVAAEAREAEPALSAPPPFQLRRILLPLDFSVSSAKAMSCAVFFASQSAAEILLVHVIESAPAPAEIELMDTAALADTPDESCGRRLKELQQEIIHRVPATTLIRHGVAHREIVEVAREKDVDLIVMGKHGRGGISHLFGGTVERIIRHAPCPVLVIREKSRNFSGATMASGRG